MHRKSRIGGADDSQNRRRADVPKRNPIEPRPGAAGWSSLVVLRWLSLALLAGLLVIAALVPSDSVAVEQGSALPLLPIALLSWVTAAAVEHRSASRLVGADRLLHTLVWVLVAWIGLAAIAVAGSGNLRAAVNEFWWWATAAATFLAARHSLRGPRARAAFTILLIAVACGQAAWAAHQQWVSLPADRARYEAAPDQVLQEVGILAPPGSAERTLFEGRLYGGGPTGSFALANSLAAVLLMGVVLSAGLLPGPATWHARMRVAIAAALAAVICGAAVLWTESRSAVVALLTSGALVGVLWATRGRQRHGGDASAQPPRRLSSTALGALAVGAVALAAGALWVMRRPGMVSGAPVSLRYRLEYWLATSDMVAEHPWFGAGPGNFQSLYVRYRVDQASESIADPHNWIMETAAAGGVPAVLLLGGAIGVGLWLTAARGAAHAAGHPQEAARRGAVAGGAAAGFLMTLAAWISQLYLPDVDALGLAVVVAVAVAVALRPVVASEPDAGAGQGDRFRRLAAAAAAGVAIHLLAAGGWTVPGVAVPWLVLLAMVVGGPRFVPAREATADPSSRMRTHARDLQPTPRAAAWGFWRAGWRRWRPNAEPQRSGPIGGWQWRSRSVILGAGLVLFGGWLWSAWLPQRQAAFQMEQADAAIRGGRFDAAAEFYALAARADRWDPYPRLRQADALRWIAIRGTDTPEVRESWAAAWQEALERHPASATLWRQRAEQRLHLFQRWGVPADLAAAREDLQHAIERDPADVGTAAQLSVVAAALRDEPAAGRWRARAEALAAAGGHSDRQLSVVQVLPPERIGQRAALQPWRVPAEEWMDATDEP